MSTYRTCAVPLCRSTIVKYPDKLFIHIPKCPKRRKQWLQLARRDTKFTSDKSAIFFCEDHSDLPNDMGNYIEYRIMGSVGKIRMKPDCLPSKFECQPDRIKRTAPPQARSAVSKRQRMNIIEEILSKETEIPATSGMTLSWSDYKKANTAKYLISSTPDVIINYISPGYSGRITDVLLVQNCNFLNFLEPGVSILADRGFKHIEEHLLQKGINLARPPSVSSHSKLSKQDVVKTKQIASLRIHIERVIRRLREFSSS